MRGVPDVYAVINSMIIWNSSAVLYIAVVCVATSAIDHYCLVDRRPKLWWACFKQSEYPKVTVSRHLDCCIRNRLKSQNTQLVPWFPRLRRNSRGTADSLTSFSQQRLNCENFQKHCGTIPLGVQGEWLWLRRLRIAFTKSKQDRVPNDCRSTTSIFFFLKPSVWNEKHPK